MSGRNNQTRRLVGGLAAILFVGGCLAVYWFTFRNPPREDRQWIAADQVITDFNIGLAALDVEENERASRVLRHAVSLEQREPALWADLAIAQIRLNEHSAARQSLAEALRLAPDSRELVLLNAEIFAHSGQVEQAIEQLRKVHQLWPENITATYSLASLLGQIRSDQADAERLELYSEILRRAPGNLQALTEQARLAATLQDQAALADSLDELRTAEQHWPEDVREQLASARKAADGGDFRRAALSLTFFQNLLKPRPEYQQSLAQLGALSLSAVGTPLREFLRLGVPPIEFAEADTQLAFELQRHSETAARPDLVLALEHPGKRSSTLVSLSADQLHVGGTAALPFPGSTESAVNASIAAADLNFDFHQDLICAGDRGVAVYLGSEEADFRHQQISLENPPHGWQGVWSADIDADGDMDLILSDGQTALRWTRNNGDSTFEQMPTLVPADAVIDVQCTDFDGDGDIDLVTVNRSGILAGWRNDRNGTYVERVIASDDARVGVTAGDVDNDGQLDIVSLSTAGRLYGASWSPDGSWIESPLTAVEPPPSLPLKTGDAAFLAVADIDNNGAVDLVASSASVCQIWLRTNSGDLLPLSGLPEMDLMSITDMDGDGLLDLVGLSDSAATVALNRSTAGYGWQQIELLANPNAGDRRVNSFGIGGRAEIRAGNLVQATGIDSPRVHFGLGNHSQADLARIVWPNGTSQAEFDFQEGQPFVANQRLKGSCPWIFAHNGHGFRFLKDFIWRSPLGLRINAQTTAGTMQTEDWIKIAGDQLANRDGKYSLRITAELWETHFFDHVSLLAVDHPKNVTILVDERFVPSRMPQHRVIAATHPQPLSELQDHRGNSIAEELGQNDGVYADRFSLGSYQGVAEEHWVEFTLPAAVSPDRPLLIVGRGWIYPTDSSLNVAIAQGSAPSPFGLVLEQQDPEGAWKTLDANLGFPSGKNKEVVIEIPPGSLAVSRRYRLRTNMEIYWDSLRWSYSVPHAERRITGLRTETADLRYRGFSRLEPFDRRRPDTPIYEVAAVQQQWLDLEGYYTRLGDVRELVVKTDDRYVIMNAGDELHFDFTAGELPQKGWQRDFILVGDGWVKDGDFNTAFSQTVRPLPSHSTPDYSGPLMPLRDDPVYLQHRDDWRHYHTRYITPYPLNARLWKSAAPPATGDKQ